MAKASSSNSSSTSANLSNLTISSASSAYPSSNTATWIGGSNTYTLGSGLNYGSFINQDALTEMYDTTLKAILVCLQESKIEEILDTVKTNLSNDDAFKEIVKAIVRLRHYSEDFLLKYIDYLDKDTIYAKHKENILSLEYHNVTLVLLERDKN